jgi:tRNA1Val (adenine37-N6)-methyltransferase
MGFELDTEMLGHARKNARQLGLAERFAPVCANVVSPGALRPESADLVVCNPPYRRQVSGRVCRQASKNPARFETEAGLEDFLRAAAFLVKNRRACAFIHLAERVDDLLTGLCAVRLKPKELLFIHPRQNQPAKLVLVRAVKNGGTSLRVAPPLFLHEPGTGTFTPQALEFCPWLAPGGKKGPCNSN